MIDQLVEMYRKLWKDIPIDTLREIVKISEMSSYNRNESVQVLSTRILVKIYEQTHIDIKQGPVTLGSVSEFATSITDSTVKELGVVLTMEKVQMEVEALFTDEISMWVIDEIRKTNAKTLISGPFMTKIYQKLKKQSEPAGVSTLNFDPQYKPMTCVKVIYELEN